MQLTRLLIVVFFCQFLFVQNSFAQVNKNIGPPFNFYFQDTMVPSEGVACMDVLVDNFEDVLAFQFAFGFDSTKFEFVRIDGPESELSKFVVGPQNTNDSVNLIRTVLYTDLFDFGTTLPDSTVLFSLCFDAIGEIGDTSTIILPDSISNGEPVNLFTNTGTFGVPEFNLISGVLTVGVLDTLMECEERCFQMGTTWIYDSNVIALNRDSVICGETWYGLSELDFCATALQDIFLRKDANAIWMHDPATSVSSILYDFTKQAGESWEIIFPGGAPSHIVLVDSVSTIDIDGQTIQVQHVSSDPLTSSYDFDGLIYDGIGSSHYLFPTDNLCDGGANGLVCFATGEQTVSIDPSRPCEPINVAVKDLRALDDLDIYPNPVQDNLYLETTEQNWDYQILNLQGQEMMQGEYQDYIGVEGLPSGIYFLQLQQENDLYQAIKFVKE